MGAEVVMFSWNGRLPKKRNWILRNHKFRTRWVLFLDADERVSEAFCNEVAAVIKDSNTVGFWISYKNHFLGRRLNYGEPNRKLALIKLGSGEYEQFEDEAGINLDMEVHEHPILNGKIGSVRTMLDHLELRGFSSWIRKHNDYSTWEAERVAKIRAGKMATLSLLTCRQRIKYALIGRLWFPIIYFGVLYIIRQGFRDGYPGFVYAVSKAIYFWHVGVKFKTRTAQAGTTPNPGGVRQ
jgi:hypothetical protein